MKVKAFKTESKIAAGLVFLFVGSLIPVHQSCENTNK